MIVQPSFLPAVFAALCAAIFCTPLWAEPAAAPLSFAEAQTLLQQAPELAAAQAAAQAAAEQRDAARHLGGPVLALQGRSVHYRVRGDLSTETVRDDVAELPLIGPLVLPRVPDEVAVDHRGHSHSAQVAAVWPVFAGGRFQAARSLLAARADEAQADTALTAQDLHTTLTERYFGSQLAHMAADLHQQAVATIGQYDHTAQRLLDEGLIARVERLQAQAKLADAQSAAERARSDAELARAGLRQLLAQSATRPPSTPLFVNTQPLPPLAHFQALALQHHPGLNKVAAKTAQARALHQSSRGRFLPTVNVFGVHQINKPHPSWAAGVSASWVLWSPLDRRAMNRAAAEKIIQAEKSDEALRQKLLLLVEQNWRRLDAARRDYIQLGSNVQLHKEVLRLRRAGLKQGVNTVAEVMEAETQLLKSKTERAKTANDYVQALAQLLASCGQPQQFNDYMARADVRIELPASPSQRRNP